MAKSEGGIGETIKTVVWALLIAAAAALAPGLSRTEGEADPVEDPLDPSGDPR